MLCYVMDRMHAMLRYIMGWKRKLGLLNILPNTVPSKAHEIVHAVIRLGDAGEHARNALSLLGLGDGLETEMGRARRIGDGIFGY